MEMQLIKHLEAQNRLMNLLKVKMLKNRRKLKKTFKSHFKHFNTLQVKSVMEEELQIFGTCGHSMQYLSYSSAKILLKLLLTTSQKMDLILHHNLFVRIMKRWNSLLEINFPSQTVQRYLDCILMQRFLTNKENLAFFSQQSLDSNQKHQLGIIMQMK